MGIYPEAQTVSIAIAPSPVIEYQGRVPLSIGPAARPVLNRFLTDWRRRCGATLRALKAETHALYLATSDRRTPWYAKLWISLVLAYALSPIDLIPDFIPILGLLDDALVIPLGLWVALRLVPLHVMQDCRDRAKALQSQRIQPKGTVVIIMATWVLLGCLAAAIAKNLIKFK